MENIILIIHLILALGIIGLVLLQRSEGGGLGIGGGSGGLGALASAGTTGNILTRATAFCAAAFFCTSLVLAILAGTHSSSKSLLESLDSPIAVPAVVEAEAEQTPSAEAPSAPLSE
jgi:preprotein translocase subunit SecG